MSAFVLTLTVFTALSLVGNPQDVWPRHARCPRGRYLSAVDHPAAPFAGHYYMAQPLSHSARSRNNTQRSAPAPTPDSLEGVCAAVHAGVVELLCVDVLVTVRLWLDVGRIVSCVIRMLCVAIAEWVYQRARIGRIILGWSLS